QKPACLKLAALRQSGPLIGFCLRFSLVPGREIKREWLTIWQFLFFCFATVSFHSNRSANKAVQFVDPVLTSIVPSFSRS
ncbi:MAG: hypothetical protein AB2708_10775, partial [Candidatus Thiodiazotropha taylori]